MSADTKAPAPHVAPAEASVRPGQRSVLSRVGHIAARVVAWSVAIVFFAVVASVGWMSRETTIRWLADQAVSQSDGALELEGVHGSFWSGIQIARVHYSSPDLEVTLDRLHLVWFWLPPNRIQVPVLSVDRAVLERKRVSADPTPVPDTLALPISIHIGRAAVAHLAVMSPGDSIVRIEGIEVDGQANARDLNFNVRVDDAMGVSVNATAAVAATAPFATAVEAKLHVRDAPMIDSVELDVRGPLARLAVTAQANFVDAASAPAVLSTTVSPFATQAVNALRLDVPRLSAASLGLVDMEAQLSGQAVLALGAEQQWQGHLAFANAMAGRVDERRLPVQSVVGDLTLNDGQARLHGLKIALVGQGEVSGSAQWLDGQGEVALSFKDVDPSALHQAALETRLAGQVRAERSAQGAVSGTLQLSGGGLSMSADAQWRDQRVTLPKFDLSAGGGRLSGQATLALDGSRAFDVAVQTQDFDPSRLMRAAKGQALPPWLQAKLRARAHAQGVLAPVPKGNWEVTIEPSRLAGLPLSGQTAGHFEMGESGLALDGVGGDVILGDSRLALQGGYGADGAVLSAALIVPKLERLTPLAGRPLAGSLEVHATAVRQGAHPVGVLSIDARDLRVGSATDGKPASTVAALGKLEGAAQLVDGGVDTRFVFTEWVVGANRLPQSSLEAKGRLEQHDIRFAGQGTSYGRPLDAGVELSGGWTTVGGVSAWRGQINRLENSGKLPLRLRSPATLVVGGDVQQLSDAVFELAGGKVEISAFVHQGDRMESRGRFDGLAVQALSRWLPAFETPRTTLTLGGAWDARMTGDQIDASLSVKREGGDVWLSTAAVGAMDLRSLDLKVDVSRNQLSSAFAFESGRLGRLKLNAQTALARRDGQWGVPGTAPLSALVQGEMQSLAWLGLVTETPLNAEGRIKIDATVGGTVGAPQLSGILSGEQLALRTFAPRAQLTDGRVRILLEGQRVELDEFVFMGRGGQVAASGQFDFSGGAPKGLIDVAFHKLAPLSDPLYHIVASGAVRIEVAEQAAKVSGQLRADEARLTLQDAMAPSLGGDVVVARGEAAPVEPPPPPLPVTVSLAFDLGDRFHVSGYGADAWLGGTLALEAKPGSPLVSRGTIETRRGSYLAYGQQLTVEQGTVSFSGPLENPGLHLKAQRPNLPVTVGVEVTGSVAQPKARLYSDPAMTNTEILSWLVLGRGLEGTTRKDAQLLSLAAGALLSKGDSVPVQTRLARSVGLDEISVRDDAALETSVIAIGKRLSERLYLSFERSLSGPATLAKLRYEVGKRWFVQGLTGTENAVDVFFSFQFD